MWKLSISVEQRSAKPTALARGELIEGVDARQKEEQVPAFQLWSQLQVELKIYGPAMETCTDVLDRPKLLCRRPASRSSLAACCLWWPFSFCAEPPGSVMASRAGRSRTADRCVHRTRRTCLSLCVSWYAVSFRYHCIIAFLKAIR